MSDSDRYSGKLMIHIPRLIIFSLGLILFSYDALAGTGRLRFLCAEDGKHYFTQTPSNADCHTNFLEEEWNNFQISSNVIVDYMPSTAVHETDGIKIWTQFILAEPLQSEEGGWQYDYVKSISKFYCGKRQTMMLQATYAYDGNIVYERPSDEAVLEEIEPGSINDSLYKELCQQANKQ